MAMSLEVFTAVGVSPLVVLVTSLVEISLCTSQFFGMASSDDSVDILDVLCGGEAASSSKRETPSVAEPSVERSCKVQKVQAEELTSVSWARRLKTAFSEHLQARGKQLRPVACASSCSGLASDTVALEDCRHQMMHTQVFKLRLIAPSSSRQASLLRESINVLEVGVVTAAHMYTIDPKPASKDFILELNLPSCHFGSVEDVTQAVTVGAALPCARHHGQCKPPSQNRLDLLTVGFPCAPFSQQRPNRHDAGRFRGSQMRE
eukprot:6455974-Amphidinium_carterae.1